MSEKYRKYNNVSSKLLPAIQKLFNKNKNSKFSSQRESQFETNDEHTGKLKY